MTDHTTYRIWTLYDIAKIPADALPRFLEELPDIINFIRIQHPELEKFKISINHIDWTDDKDPGINGFRVRIKPAEKEED